MSSLLKSHSKPQEAGNGAEDPEFQSPPVRLLIGLADDEFLPLKTSPADLYCALLELVAYDRDRSRKLAELAARLNERREAGTSPMFAELARLINQAVDYVAARPNDGPEDSLLDAAWIVEAKHNFASGIVKGVAEFLLQHFHFARDAGERLFVYRQKLGTYLAGDLFVRQWVKMILTRNKDTAQKWSSYRGQEVVRFLALEAPRLWEQPPVDRICLLNGILDVETGELHPHSQEFLTRIQIPVRYDPNATCPASEKFVSEVFPEDCTDLAWEIFGDAMTPDRSVQKSIMLTGSGGNGKGAFLAWLIAFIGKENVATQTLHNLEESRFAAADLYGKLINVAGDLPKRPIKETSIFKELTGNDPVTVERKNEHPFKFWPFARLLFSANKAPATDDNSQAFLDRWVVIPFERRFRGTDRDRPRRKLDAELSNPAELSGVLNRALPALRRVRRLHRFTESKSIQAATARFQAATNPLAAWLRRETIAHPNAAVPCDALLDVYSRENGQLNQTLFGIGVRDLYPKVRIEQRGGRKSRKRYYVGIGLRTDLKDPH